MRRLPHLLLLLAFALPLASPASGAAQCPAEPAGPVADLSASLGAIPPASTRDLPFRTAAVPADKQRETLAEILSRVNDRKLARVEDPSLPRAVVVLDFDYTVGMHVRRTEESIRRVAARYGIAELADPTTLPLLPTFQTDGFQRWIDALGLRAQYPDVDWERFQRDVLGAQWHPDLANSEVLTPGVHEFLRRVKYTGGRVVILTGRREHERADLQGILAAAGITDLPLILKTGSKKTPAWKAEKIAEIEAAHGEIVAIVDDLAENRDAMLGAMPGRDVLSVPIAVPGFTTDLTPDALAASPWAISTFERNRADPGS